MVIKRNFISRSSFFFEKYSYLINCCDNEKENKLPVPAHKQPVSFNGKKDSYKWVVMPIIVRIQQEHIIAMKF